MSSHCTVETLSAFLDRELPRLEAREVEGHLDRCLDCRQQLEALAGVVSSLRSLERVSPPTVLEQDVQRRIALVSQERGLGSRLAGTLPQWPLQPGVLLSFSLVFAFALIIYFFAEAVERRRFGSVPVLWESPVANERASGGSLRDSARRELAGRLLIRRAGAWWEEGIDPEAERVVMQVGTAEWEQLIARRPALEILAGEAEPVVISVERRVLEIRPSPEPSLSSP